MKNSREPEGQALFVEASFIPHYTGMQRLSEPEALHAEKPGFSPWAAVGSVILPGAHVSPVPPLKMNKSLPTAILPRGTLQVQVGMLSITHAALESGAPPVSFLPLRESKRHTEEHTPSRLRALDWMKTCELLGSSVCYLTGPDGLQPANDLSRRLFSAGFIFDVSLSSCCSVAFSKSLTSA